ncbi:unnamed protein product [Mucor fragilis]
MKALIADDALEQPYCRRFAGLLDFVFQGAGIDMQDGEIVSIATRQAMESNDSDGRRIGLLLARKGCAAELCSNEWKNTINEGMKFKQQAKHIRSNTTILSSLYLKSSGQLGQGIAGEFVGPYSERRHELIGETPTPQYPSCLPTSSLLFPTKRRGTKRSLEEADN